MSAMLVTGVTVAAVLGILLILISGVLWGFALGAEAAIHQTNNLRRVAVCEGERGCEWSYNGGMGRTVRGRPVSSAGGNFRYYRPFERLPLLGRTRLGRLTYDLAEPLQPRGPLPARPPGDG